MIKFTKILNAMISIENEGVFVCECVEYDGKVWIVPEWKDYPAKGYSRPARIICLSNLPHTGRFSGVDYVLRDPIPRAVYDGHPTEEQRKSYFVIENPEVFVDIRA
jgi:hypothetical protein